MLQLLFLCVIIALAEIDVNYFIYLYFRKEVNVVREGIHPDYKQTVIKCACGNVIETGSTKENVFVEICAKCHPFYTGKQKLVDTGGRVEKFRKKFNMDK